MTRTLTFKLIAAFVLVALITGLVLAGVFRTLNATRLDDFVLDQQTESLLTQLQTYYTQTGSWDGLREPLLLNTMGTPSGTGPSQGMGQGLGQGMGMGGQGQGNPNAGGQGMRGSGSGGMDSRRLFGLADQKGLIVIPYGSYTQVGQAVEAADLRNGHAVVVDHETVGTLLRVQRLPVYSAAEQAFLQKTNLALLWAMIGAALAAILVGVLIARSLTRPLNQLTASVRTVGKGQPFQQVSINSHDEIGELSQAYNQMIAEIEQGTQLRKQMTADIAHDLRTPLTVIGGYIESMRDNVLQPTPERLTLINAEIERLKRMVGDLRTLSMADAGELPLQRQSVEPRELIHQAGELFRPLAEQKGVQLNIRFDEALPLLNVDETRMVQVLENLLANALRFTSSGGSITLSAVRHADQVQLSVSDTGSGIPPEELKLIFERFHKADKARTNDAGSGLGLAIVKALVEAHGGTISAQSAPGTGSKFIVTLPAQI